MLWAFMPWAAPAERTRRSMGDGLYSIGVIFLHPGCNMRCSFCVTDDTFSAMRYDQALRLLDFVKARSIDSVVLGGGEPFTWEPGVVRLAREAKDRCFIVQAGTNGLALPEGYERLDCIDRYVLPLDGADEATHNSLRHCSGGHHRIILGRLARLREAGKAVTISTVVTARNIGQLCALGHFLADYASSGAHLHAWHLYQFIPEGRGGAVNAKALRVDEPAYDAACAEVKAMDLGFTIYKRKDMRHSQSVDFFWYEGERIVVGSEVWGQPAASPPQQEVFLELSGPYLKNKGTRASR